MPTHRAGLITSFSRRASNDGKENSREEDRKVVARIWVKDPESAFSGYFNGAFEPLPTKLRVAYPLFPLPLIAIAFDLRITCLRLSKLEISQF